MTTTRETWTHNFVDTNGIRMHYVEQGDGFPVLLLHGFPELWYSWRHQIPALAKAGFRVIVPDLRGYGESDKPYEVEAYDIQHLVADLVGLLDALGIDKTVIAGHDWGGIIIWQFALMHPERVERVIALNTPFIPRGPINFYRNFHKNWETTEHLMGKQVTAPSLMITAEKDPVLKPEMANGMERWVPNVRFHRVKDSGHWTQQEQPEEVNRAMIDFLSDLRC